MEIEPGQRSNDLIIIGASNVTLALPMLWHTVAGNTDRSTRLIVAAGHGRSFGLPNTVLARTLPSILECGLWDMLQAGSVGASRRALVTDIGNDLLYGVGVDNILDWVATVLERLSAAGCAVSLSLPPLASLVTLTPRRYYFFRRLLFPRANLGWEDAMASAHALTNGIIHLAEARGLPLIEPSGAWYGADPIHIRRGQRASAWCELMSFTHPEFAPVSPWPIGKVRIWRHRPAVRWMRNSRQDTPQPAAASASSELWLF